MMKWVILRCGLNITLECEYVVIRQPHDSADKMWTRTNLILSKDLKILFPTYSYVLHIEKAVIQNFSSLFKTLQDKIIGQLLSGHYTKFWLGKKFSFLFIQTAVSLQKILSVMWRPMLKWQIRL